MDKNTCCFTGHRKIPPWEQRNIENRLTNEIESLIQSGICFFGAGGALGFDTLAAATVLKLRDRYSHIKLILVLPCESQTSGWHADDVAVYKSILSQCNKIVFTSQSYYQGCMQKRNRHLVDNSQVCISYLNRPTGGTAYTVNYAQQLGLQVINLAHRNS